MRDGTRTRAGAILGMAVACACHGGCIEPQPAVGPAPSAPVVVAPPPVAPVVLPPVAAVIGGLCPAPNAPENPVQYGQCVLAQSVARAHLPATTTVSVVLASDPAAQGVDVAATAESFGIVSQGDRTLVVGRDQVGAMYGAMEVAERLDMHGAAALPITTAVKASPFLAIRGANPFLVLPEPNRPWWFRDPEFWTQYLDMMTKGRLNLLDLHCMYNLDNTRFPNALLFFATSVSMPNVGIPAAERAANLAMLNTVIKMAETRGIKVGLMTYSVSVSLSGEAAEKETEEMKAIAPQYNREAVADLAMRAPGLSYLGFRIGETGRTPDWFVSTYVDPLKAAHGRAVPYTRTWLTKKSDLLSVLQTSGPDTLLEVKYNGEQYGQPYVISGGSMAKWASYSYEDYLEEPAPYRFVFQVRAGGTHRLFRYASYSRSRRAVLSMTLSPRVQGFTFEAAHAYLPQRDFYHVHPEDSFSPYAFRRDELSYLLFGRLGYDPNTPEAVFKKMLADRVGTDKLWDAVQAASEITPEMLAGFDCGPDQRDYAPELDIGGPVDYWATPKHTKVKGISCRTGHTPFDDFAVSGPYETALDLVEGHATSRVPSVDVALTVMNDARLARAASQVAIDPNNREARDVVRECGVLADMGEWFAHKYRAATALAVYELSPSKPWLDTAKGEVHDEIESYKKLVQDTAYIAPFEERLRMSHTKMTEFHWQRELPFVEKDVESVDEVVTQLKSQPARPHVKGLPNPKAWLNTPKRPGPGLAALEVSPENARAASWTVTVKLAAPPPPGAVVRVLHRSFRSNQGDWTAVDAQGSGTTYRTTVPGKGEGSMFAVEVDAGPGQAWRYPDVTRETPYRSLAP